MAQIHEEVVIVKLSKLVKAGTGGEPLAGDEFVAAIEQVAQELVAAGVIVEVEKA